MTDRVKAAFTQALLLSVCASCQGTEGELLLFDPAESDPLPGSSQGGSPSTTDEAGAEWAVPDPNLALQIQLTGIIDLSNPADLFIIDLHAPADSVFSSLRAESKYIACYFSAATFEPWRPDVEALPMSTIGERLANYPQERWLDIVDGEVFEVMRARMQLASQRGCDAVYPVVVRPPDGEAGGWMIPVELFESYSRQLALAAHALGLGALSDGSLSAEGAAQDYDALVVLGCIAGGTCDNWVSYSESGRGVFLVELGVEADAASACGSERPHDWPVTVKLDDFSSFSHICPD